AWSGDIRLYQVTSMNGTRAPTAKRRNDIGAGDHGSDRVCGLKNPGISQSGTAWPFITRDCYHHNAGPALGLNKGSKHVAIWTRNGSAPGVVSDVRGFGRVALAWVATHRVRCQDEFHALDDGGRCAETELVKRTTADPLCTGCHPDLISS